MADLKYIGKNIFNHDLIVRKGNVSGSVTSTGSFGELAAARNATVDNNIVVGNRITADYGTVNYSLVVNEAGHGGGDFRVEGTSDPYLIFADAGTDQLAIGTSVVSPSLLTVDGDITATHVTASGDISGSSTSTGSFGSVVVSDKVQGNLKIGEGIVYDDTNKRLGIGDPVPTSPESELHIKAATPEITIQRTDNNNDGVIDFQGSAGYVGAKIAHSGTDNNLVFHTYTGSTLKERLTITGGSAGTKISGSAVSTGSFGAVVFDDFISGSSSTSASFGRIDTAGSIYASGRVYESGTSIVDHATAMAIVFGG